MITLPRAHRVARTLLLLIIFVALLTVGVTAIAADALDALAKWSLALINSGQKLTPID